MAQVNQRSSQFILIIRYGGEVGDQLPLDGQAVAVGGFGLLWLACGLQQVTQVDVVCCEILPILGYTGEISG